MIRKRGEGGMNAGWKRRLWMNDDRRNELV